MNPGDEGPPSLPDYTRAPSEGPPDPPEYTRPPSEGPNPPTAPPRWDVSWGNATVPPEGHGRPPATGELSWQRRYQLLQVIARGGMGIVYRAHDVVLKRTVALKFIHGELLGSDMLAR